MNDMNKEPGTVKLFRAGNISVFVHWSLPVVTLLLSIPAIVGFEAALAVCLAYVFILALHESAHALAARHFGLKVYSLTISAMGGLCRHDAPRTYGAAFAVASAGLFAQLLLLVASQTYLNIVGEPDSRIGHLVLLVFVYANGFLVLTNLIPEKRRYQPFGTDGFLIWKLAARRLKGLPFANPDTSVTLSPETRLLRLEGFRPDGFTSGIEILNDNTTPMEFVVGTLSRHLEMPREQAIELMLAAHTRGGLVIPLAKARAEIVAAAIARDAVEAGHPLVCRVAVAVDP